MTPSTCELPYAFAPRSYQWDIWDAWDMGIRRFIAVWHRRAGKDKTFLNFCIERMLERKGNYVHLFPLKTQARRAIWHGIDRDGRRYLDHFPPELIYGAPNDQEMCVTLRDPANPLEPGSTFSLLGADKDFNVMVGSNPVGIIISEWAIMNPRAWELTRPILRENGGWVAFCYTPRGKNHGHSLYCQVKEDPTWHVSFLTVDNTRRDGAGEDGSPVITQEGIAQDRAEGMTEADILQEYYCSWETPMKGAVYGDEMRAAYAEQRVGSVPVLPGYPVYTAWDLGYSAPTSIWFFQVIPGADGRPWYHFIDYLEDNLKALGYWVAQVRGKPYIYAREGEAERHYGPHDMGQHELGYGKTRDTIAQEQVMLDDGRLALGLMFTVVPQASLADGIVLCRKFLSRCRFDVARCEMGIHALSSYRYNYDEHAQQWQEHPFHDWASHGADALRIAFSGVTLGETACQLVAPGGSFAWARKQAERQRAHEPLRTFRIGG